MIKCLIVTVRHTNIRKCHFLPPNMYSKNARKIKDGQILKKIHVSDIRNVPYIIYYSNNDTCAH